MQTKRCLNWRLLTSLTLPTSLAKSRPSSRKTFCSKKPLLTGLSVQLLLRLRRHVSRPPAYSTAAGRWPCHVLIKGVKASDCRKDIHPATTRTSSRTWMFISVHRIPWGSCWVSLGDASPSNGPFAGRHHDSRNSQQLNYGVVTKRVTVGPTVPGPLNFTLNFPLKRMVGRQQSLTFDSRHWPL